MSSHSHTPALLPIGTTVKVNCYLGRITDVVTGIETQDPVTKATVTVPLANPIYHIQLSLRKAYKRVEHAQYIWLRKGRTQLRLFPDEFEVVALPAFMDTRQVIRRFSTRPSQPVFSKLARSV
ncbi:MAG: hypothetical protein KF690_09505 [Bacteroidetes bacterium]|nr:hypothetical protein [Bacteroidota bacterium]